MLTCSFAVEAVKAPAFSNEFQNAVILVFDAFGIVLFVALVPEEFPVFMLKVRRGLSEIRTFLDSLKNASLRPRGVIIIGPGAV